MQQELWYKARRSRQKFAQTKQKCCCGKCLRGGVCRWYAGGL